MKTVQNVDIVRERERERESYISNEWKCSIVQHSDTSKFIKKKQAKINSFINNIKKTDYMQNEVNQRNA